MLAHAYVFFFLAVLLCGGWALHTLLAANWPEIARALRGELPREPLQAQARRRVRVERRRRPALPPVRIQICRI